MSGLLPWPDAPPGHDGVRLRRFRTGDVAVVVDLATDPYVPDISTLPARADEAAAHAWIERQRQRDREGIGWSFAVADAVDDRALGQLGLWPDGAVDTVGYLVAPRARGAGVAARALRAVVPFAGAVGLVRLQAFVEPANTASVRPAERAGLRRTDVVPHPRRPDAEPVPMLRFVLELAQTS